jgi:hypothetical protein
LSKIVYLSAGFLAGQPFAGSFSIAQQKFFGFGVRGTAFGTIMTLVMVILIVVTALLARFAIERPDVRLSKALADRLGRERLNRGSGQAGLSALSS